MPRKYAKRSKRSNRRRNRRTVRRSVRTPKNESCKITETITIDTAQTALTPYESNINLRQFSRAVDIADNFQEYRIKKLIFKYTPFLDTFTDATTGAGAVPYLWSKRHIYPAPTTFGKEYLQALGAKPRRLDDKTLTVSYSPNIFVYTNSEGGSGVSRSQGMPKYSPWLSTHYLDAGTGNTVIDNTVHFGHAWWIDKVVDTGNAVCAVELTAVFEFKKPWDLATQANPQARMKKVL